MKYAYVRRKLHVNDQNKLKTLSYEKLGQQQFMF